MLVARTGTGIEANVLEGVPVMAPVVVLNARPMDASEVRVLAGRLKLVGVPPVELVSVKFTAEDFFPDRVLPAEKAMPAGATSEMVRANGSKMLPPEFVAVTLKDWVAKIPLGVPVKAPVVVLKLMPFAVKVVATVLGIE